MQRTPPVRGGADGEPECPARQDLTGGIFVAGDGGSTNWAGMLRADFVMTIEGLRQYAYAAGARRDVSLQRHYLHQVAQLEALPKPWEGGRRLTEEEYSAAVRVRAWVLHEQRIEDDLRWAKQRRTTAQELELREARLRARTRYHHAPRGQVLCAALRDDGRIALNSEILTTDAADRLRRRMPQFADLITYYQDNQAAGNGLQGAPVDRTPLPGPARSSPEPTGPAGPDATPGTARPGRPEGALRRPASRHTRWMFWRRRRHSG
ncbi:hypothetical protein [Streptomyces cremeus]|uniref:Uncharacterized protein n=1 Tax=Streptomyces cremeus TaxID=66881 RepID=A0ABV5PKJ6_STRCM